MARQPRRVTRDPVPNAASSSSLWANKGIQPFDRSAACDLDLMTAWTSPLDSEQIEVVAEDRQDVLGAIAKAVAGVLVDLRASRIGLTSDEPASIRMNQSTDQRMTFAGGDPLLPAR